jgi:hypothetical protein
MLTTRRNLRNRLKSGLHGLFVLGQKVGWDILPRHLVGTGMTYSSGQQASGSHKGLPSQESRFTPEKLTRTFLTNLVAEYRQLRHGRG